MSHQGERGAGPAPVRFVVAGTGGLIRAMIEAVAGSLLPMCWPRRGPGKPAIAGIWMVVQGIELRRTGKTLDSALPEKQPA